MLYKKLVKPLLDFSAANATVDKSFFNENKVVGVVTAREISFVSHLAFR